MEHAQDKAEAIATLKAEHEKDKTGAIHQLEGAYRAREEELRNQLAEGEAALDQTRQELEDKVSTIGHLSAVLSQHSQRIQQAEGERDHLAKEIEELRRTLDDTFGSLMSAQARIEQVEAWNEHNQARAEAAFTKLRSDASSLEKAKRALAIALTLIADLPALEDPGPPAIADDEYTS